MPFEPTNALPADLEDIALATFDRLVGDGQIYYSPPKVEVKQIDGLQVIDSIPLILLLAEVTSPIVSFFNNISIPPEAHTSPRCPRSFETRGTVR